MPSTRKKRRLLDHPNNKLGLSEFSTKRDPLMRMKKYKLKSKKLVDSKKLVEQLNQAEEGMFLICLYYCCNLLEVSISEAKDLS